MPDLQEVLKAHTSHRPEYTDHMWGWINYLVHPYRVKRLTIFTEPDYIYGTVKINIVAQNVSGVFVYDARSAECLDDSTSIAEKISRAYAQWLLSFYIPPGDHIELGEN